MNTTRDRIHLPLLLAVAAIAALAGCGKGRDLSPPQVAYGQQQCEHCRMIISEERFAAALVVDGPDELQKWAFDDIGCLLDWVRTHKPNAGDVPYVHDYATNAWLDAREAVYVKCDRLQSPMASNLAAFAGRDGAERFQARFSGPVLTYTEVSQPDANPAAENSKGSRP